MKDYIPFFRQSHIGKLIGAFLGFIMAGPLGAFFGIFIGNFFDKGISSFFSRPCLAYHLETRETHRAEFLKATFSVLGHIAKTNGPVTQADIRIAKSIMHDLKLNRKQKESCQQFFKLGKEPSFNLAGTLVHFKTVCFDNSDLIKLFADLQYHALQKVEMSEAKLTKLNEVFSLIGYAPIYSQQRFYSDFFDQFSQFQQQARQQRAYSSSYEYQQRSTPNARQTTQDAYSILGVSATATQAEVKRKYRKLMSQHHPDKLVAKKATEKELKAANEKTQAISRAYETICEQRGW